MKKCMHLEYNANDSIKELLLSPKPIIHYRVHDKNSNKITKFGALNTILREYLIVRGFKLEPKEKLYHNKVNTLMGVDIDVDKIEDNGALVKLMIRVMGEKEEDIKDKVELVCSYIENTTGEKPDIKLFSKTDSC